MSFIGNLILVKIYRELWTVIVRHQVCNIGKSKHLLYKGFELHCIGDKSIH